MRDEGDCQEGQDFSLSGRIGRIEKFLNIDIGMPRAADLEAAGQRPLNFDQRDYGDESTFESAKYQRQKQETFNRFMSDRVTQPPEPTALEDIISRINGSSERILNYAANLEIVANRIMGELPRTDEGSCGVEARPDGTLDHTYLALNVLDSAITRLHSVALRLERI